MTLETVAPTWKHKHNVDETIVFGGDLGANGSAASSWTNGAYSIQRACALALGDYIELDFTFDAKSNGHGIAVGLSVKDPDQDRLTSTIVWEWGTDQVLRGYENGSLAFSVGVITLPMSARIIYNAGVLTMRSNAGSDVLRFTSARAVDLIYADMFAGLSIDCSFFGTSGKMHATLKGGTSSTPVIAMDGSTGRLGVSTIQVPTTDMSSYRTFGTRVISAEGFPPLNLHPRPTEGKIWPRKI
jgi:hypothetical protein